MPILMGKPDVNGAMPSAVHPRAQAAQPFAVAPCRASMSMTPKAQYTGA